MYKFVNAILIIIIICIYTTSCEVSVNPYGYYLKVNVTDKDKNIVGYYTIKELFVINTNNQYLDKFLKVFVLSTDERIISNALYNLVTNNIEYFEQAHHHRSLEPFPIINRSKQMFCRNISNTNIYIQTNYIEGFRSIMHNVYLITAPGYYPEILYVDIQNTNTYKETINIKLILSHFKWVAGRGSIR